MLTWLLFLPVTIFGQLNLNHPILRAADAMAASDAAYRREQAEIEYEKAADKARYFKALNDGYSYWTEKLNGLTSNPTAFFRRVGDATNAIDDMKVIEGQVLQVVDHGVLLTTISEEPGSWNRAYTGPVVFVDDFPFAVVDEDKVTVQAIRTGTYRYTATTGAIKTVAEYSCGTPVSPTKQMLDEKALSIKGEIDSFAGRLQEEAAKVQKAKELAEEKKKASQLAALQANEDAAKKGDAYGLLRMGERYRDGEGVEKDIIKAKEFLKRSADAGSITAGEELSRLQP